MTTSNLPNKILYWYDNNKRILPWRKKVSNKQKEYYTLVSEFMLQQTQVKTVIPYFKNFILKIPNLKILSRIRDDSLMKYWEGLGYYSRARNLKKTAKIIIDKFDGRIPQNESDLKSLPGIGTYTSKAIMSIAFNKKIIPLDGNVERILKRIFYLKTIKEISKENLEKKISFFKKTKRASDYSQAIMEIGALICKPVNPLCFECPISKYCESFKKKKFDIFNMNKFNKQKFFEANIFQNRKNKYYLLKNKKFNFLKEMLIFPMNEIPKIKFKNHIGKKINIKMSNMDMKIIIKKKYKFPNVKDGFFVGEDDLKKFTLPSFTKKIINSIKNN